MILLQKICARLRHPFRQPIKDEIHLDSTFHRTRYYICRVCGEVIREDQP